MIKKVDNRLLNEENKYKLFADMPLKKWKKKLAYPINKKNQKALIVYDTGKVRHFTPAAQEWFNSIYVYNKNYLKTLPAADINLIKLLKSYFNSSINYNIYKTPRKPLAVKERKLSTKRVFVGKGELKHTNNKVNITIYIYNAEGMYLSKLYQRAKKVWYYPNSDLNRKFTLDSKDTNKLVVTYNRKFSLNDITSIPNQYEWYLTYLMRYVVRKNRMLSLVNKYYVSLSNLTLKNIISEKEKVLLFTDKIKKIKSLPFLTYPKFLLFSKHAYFCVFFKYFYLISFNETKFNRTYINKLVNLLKKFYCKDVLLNIVNLKKMHLNSDIYTQAVALKLKTKGTRLYRVLKGSLQKVKLPIISRIEERLSKPNKEDFFINRIRNNTISSMLCLPCTASSSQKNNAFDPLNNLLLKYFPSIVNLKSSRKERWSIIKYSISFNNYLLKHLKHMKLRGIRVEAKGRLTRRRTASRSVFKMKLKGGLKNVESSFRGLSAIMLRGIYKSNVQYSIVNSKTRNGAFGVKGWVSSK